MNNNMNSPEIEQSIDIAEYYYIIAKHKWLIIASFILVVSLTIFITFQMKPVYQAGNTMIIEKDQIVSPLTGEKMDYESYVSQTLTFNTHFKMIASRPVLEKVIDELNLDQPEKAKKMETSFLKEWISRNRKNFLSLIGQKEKVLTPEDKKAALIAGLGAKITIKEVRDTRLLNVNVEDYDPDMAKEIANTLADVYIRFNAESRMKSSKNTLKWMTDQLYETKQKLEKAEKDFLDYKQNEKLFSIQGKQDVTIKKIEEFNNTYIEARNRRLEVDAKLGKLKQLLNSRGEVLHVRSLIGNALIDSLYSQLSEAEVEMNRLSSVFKPMHPKIVQMQSRIEETRKKLNEELKKEMENLDAERSVLRTREKILQETIDGFENDALATGKKELQYSILQRNVTTHQKLYDTLLSKIKESNIEESLDVSPIRVIEDAVTPISPVKPKKMMNITLGAVLGLMLGIALAFLQEYMDRSLRTEEDVQKYLDLPVLSVIPEAELP